MLFPGQSVIIMGAFFGQRLTLVRIAVFVATVLCWPNAAFAQRVNEIYVTTEDVHLREGPGTGYQVITTIPKDVKINVVGREGYWLKVESKHGGKPGYIDDRYARRLDAQPRAQTPTAAAAGTAGLYRTLRDIDLRDGPGLNYGVVATLPAGIKVNVTRAEGDWLRVESKHGGKPGYVERRDVERWSGR